MRTGLIAALLLLTANIHADAHTLTVEVSDIETPMGELHIALFTSEETYAARDGDDGVIAAVTGSSVQATFNQVPSGDVLVLLYHDVNSNGRLDTNFLGIPSEPYASTTGKRGRLGPPSWVKGKVSLNSDAKFEISLR